MHLPPLPVEEVSFYQLSSVSTWWSIILRAMDVVEVWRPMTMNSCGQDTISAPKGVVSMYQSIIHRIIWSILQRIKQLFVRILWKCKIASYFYWKLKCIFFSCIIYSIYHHTEVWNNSWCHCMKTQKFDYSRSKVVFLMVSATFVAKHLRRQARLDCKVVFEI